MEKRFDLIAIGDSTVDTFLKIHDATVECDINHKDCKICVKYGSKIPVDSIGHGVAGNAANVAVACSKLGLKTAIYTNLGDDDHGENINKQLISQKVAPDYIKINKGKSSNLSVVMTFQGERTIFVYHQEWFYHLPDLAPSAWIYLTSMAESFTSSNIMDEVYHYVEKTKSKLVFSPGTLQLKADIKRYPKILERCHILIVNLEEAKIIMGIAESEKIEIRNLLSKMLLLGPKIVVITDGEEGSYATNGQVDLKAGIIPAPVVEKTGAGDAYASGFLCALFRGADLAEAMVWGSLNSSQVIGRMGAQNGLLDAEQMIKLRKKESDFVAVRF